MKFDLSVQECPLRESFALSHTVVRRVDVLSLKAAIDGIPGEAQVSTGSSRTAEVCAAIEVIMRRIASAPGSVAQVRELLYPYYGKVRDTATLAVEMVMLDSLSRRDQAPLWSYLGLPEPRALPTFTTVDLETERYPWRDTAGRYKVKLGGPLDAAVIRSCRESDGSLFLFDANSAWDLPTYLAHAGDLRACAPLGVEDPVRSISAIEPIRATWRQRRIFLDESISDLDSVETYAEFAAGINIKLLKFGGLLPALDGATAAREAGAQVMLGCFIEPERSIAYAAHLTGLADLADLDGDRWLTGVVRDQVCLGPGIGVGGVL